MRGTSIKNEKTKKEKFAIPSRNMKGNRLIFSANYSLKKKIGEINDPNKSVGGQKKVVRKGY